MPKECKTIYDTTFTAGNTVSIPVTFADADAYTMGFNRISAGATITLTIDWLVAGATALTETLFSASTALVTCLTASKTAFTDSAVVKATSTGAQTLQIVTYKKYQGA